MNNGAYVTLARLFLTRQVKYQFTCPNEQVDINFFKLYAVIAKRHLLSGENYKQD